MRLFVAIVPPPEALGELAAVVEPLQVAAPDLRWAGRESWHLTLAFLGEVDEGLLAELSTRLERAAGRHPQQRLSITGAGAFPSAGKARVVWAGIKADGRALAALAASVAAGARRAGAPPPDEGRKYHPHLTLARCRQPADVRSLTNELALASGPAWTADAIHLIRSHLTTSSPRYEQVGSWPLRPEAGQ
ncbi:MAG TPA: RNA 2',3'-cyclic phosphodiesterase [Streptosporangiaceae bacterium]|nr:RNA 2',3'-cyclic phosphodiesterase [Streptosporangiaceae bacterium]